MKFVLSTGFNHFWRGRRQKERMYVAPHRIHSIPVLIVT